MARGLLEFAHQEGLPAVQALIGSCIEVLQARLDELSIAGAPPPPSNALEQERHLSCDELSEAMSQPSAGAPSTTVAEDRTASGSTDGANTSSSKSNTKQCKEAADTGAGGHLPLEQRASGQARSNALHDLPLAEAMQAMLGGFESSVEQQYTAWLSAQTSSLVSSIAILQLIQLVACAIRTAAVPGGVRTVLLSDLPVYLLHTVPQVIILVLVHQKQSRWVLPCCGSHSLRL
jgi:hypothetical protein